MRPKHNLQCPSWESVVLGVWNRQQAVPQCACQETAAKQGQHRHDRQRSEVRALKLQDHELRLADWWMPTAGRWSGPQSTPRLFAGFNGVCQPL